MTPQPQTYYCTECGQPTPIEGLARFGDRLVCANCKTAFAQKLREGVAPAGVVRYGGFWLRFVAVMIDGIILAIPMGILQAMLFAMSGPSMARIAPNPNADPAEVFAAFAPMFGMIGQTTMSFTPMDRGLIPGWAPEDIIDTRFWPCGAFCVGVDGG